MSSSTINPTPPTRTGKGAAATCPFLGTAEDPEAFFSYPSEGNYCFRATPPGAVEENYQKSTCLTARHGQCPVFQPEWKGPFPKDISDEVTHQATPRQKAILLVLLVVVALATIAGVAYLGLGGSINALRTDEPNLAAALLPRPSDTPELRPSATASAIPTLPPTNLPLVLIPTDLPTEPPTPTPTITATFTPPAPTPGPEMATPFGPGNLYVLHTVQPRESLTNIAVQYSTTVEMIKALNYVMEGASVWPERVLVIMPTVGDLNKAVQFCVYRVEIPTTLTLFSERYGVPVDEIRQYNAFGPDDELPAPRWLIFPYASMNTPSLCR